MDNLETTTKKFITSLLTSTPLVVTMQQLSKDYRNTIGEPIPYQKLGYNSLEHFLRSIDDTVVVNGVGPMAKVVPIYSEKSAHVNSLVQSQKIPSTKNRNFHSRRTTYMSRKPTQPTRKIHYPPVVKNFFSESNSSSQSSSIDYITYTDTTGQKANTTLTNAVPEELRNYFRTTYHNGNNESRKTDMSSDNKYVNVCQKTETPKIEKTYVDSSQKTEKPNAEKKYVAVSQKTETPKVVKPETPFKNVHNKKCSSVKNLMKHVTSDKNKESVEETRVPFHIKNNLRSLITQFPNGIWCAEVPQSYRKMFKQELNYQELGYGTLINLCTDLSSIFHYVRPSNGDFKLYDKSRPLPACAEKKFTVASYSVNKTGFLNLESESALPRIDWADVNTYLPEDIFKPDEEIPRAFVSPNVEVNDSIDVVVGEVYDLSKFWVYLVDSPLDQLMDDMQDFYKDHAAEYEIPNHLLKEGLYCVQVIFGEYHRALIVDVMPEVEDTIRVIFIDYGTMSKVSSIGVCFLHTQFSSIPAQAIRCRLANIMPPEEGVPWSKEASKAFKRLVVDIDTSAKISHINWEEQILEVYLADVTDEENIFYINDKLVEDGFATYCDKDRRQPHVDPIYKPIVKLIHLFPTFLELEHGLAPSTAEMEVFHDLDIPINFCYPQYFYVDYSFEQEVIKMAEDFHEANMAKAKRRVPTRFYDIEKLRQSPVDFTIFGELGPEIKAFLDKAPEEKSIHDSDEDFVDAEEEFLNMDRNQCDAFDSIAEQLKALNTKEEETVNVLRRDLQMTESIMKDINQICKIEPVSFDNGDMYSDYLSDNLCNELKDYPVKCENVSFEEYYQSQEERHLWTINETRESIETQNSSMFCNEIPEKADEDDGEVFFNHPLSKMSFDAKDEQSSSHSPTSESSPTSLNVDALNLSTHCDMENLPSGDAFISQITQILEATHKVKSDEEKDALKPEMEANSATNPFLSDVGAGQDVSLKDLRLNSSNPFLTYVRNESSASLSSAYESPVRQVKKTHAWSHFDDISAETISELGRSISSKSSSSSSLMIIDDKRNCSISTQTSNEQVLAGNYPACPQLYPQPVAYGYTQWSLGYANPYYRQSSNQLGYYEPHGPAYRPQVPSVPPGFPPPPGFMPLGSTGYPQPIQNYYSGANLFPVRDGRCYGPRPFSPPPGQFFARPGVASVSAMAVNVVNNDNDFYDAYNANLREKPNGDVK